MLRDVIHFYRVKDLNRVKGFYENILGLKLYKDQKKCLIYDANHGKIGFCLHFPPEKADQSYITFVFDRVEELRVVRQTLLEGGYAPKPIETNDYFRITHFFVRDKDDLNVEFQVFL